MRDNKYSNLSNNFKLQWHRILFVKKLHLHDNKSLYKFDGDTVNLWQLYNAFTQRITDGKIDIDQLPNKTLAVTNMLMEHIKVGEIDKE